MESEETDSGIISGQQGNEGNNYQLKTNKEKLMQGKKALGRWPHRADCLFSLPGDTVL